MKYFLSAVLLLLLAGCRFNAEDAKTIAYDRLSEGADRPSMQGDDLRSALTATKNGEMYLVELTDLPRNRLWAVIVQPSGDSEITYMEIDRKD